MGANSKIEWCDHTFNPWTGCTKVSGACDHCYAESWAKRSGHPELWAGDRRRTSAANWKQPLKWNAAAAKAGVRARVFCASLADVFDNQVPEDWRSDLWSIVRDTSNLDWLMLTKRPQNIPKMLPAAYGFGDPDHPVDKQEWPWPNVWLGTTAENQEEADRRIPHLLAVPAKVHFLSCEPLLAPIDLTSLPSQSGIGRYLDALSNAGVHSSSADIPAKIDWVICGGESGPHARPMHPDWARSLRDQCAAAGVAFHFKQWGEWIEWRHAGVGQLTNVTPQRPDYSGQHLSKAFANGEPLFEGRALPTIHPERGNNISLRVGKSRAGRLLDGVEHNGFPG